MTALISTTRLALDRSKSGADHGDSASIAEVAAVMSPLIVVSGGGGGGGGDSLLLSSSTHLLSADILALNTSPFELVPAPGVNKEIIVVAWGANLIFVANAYTTGTVTAWYGDYNDGIDVFTLGNLIAQGADQSRRGSGTVGSSSTESFELHNIVNQPIMLAPVFSDPTGGDGTLKVTVYYIIRDLSA